MIRLTEIHGLDTRSSINTYAAQGLNILGGFGPKPLGNVKTAGGFFSGMEWPISVEAAPHIIGCRQTISITGTRTRTASGVYSVEETYAFSRSVEFARVRFPNQVSAPTAGNVNGWGESWVIGAVGGLDKCCIGLQAAPSRPGTARSGYDAAWQRLRVYPSQTLTPLLPPSIEIGTQTWQEIGVGSPVTVPIVLGVPLIGSSWVDSWLPNFGDFFEGDWNVTTLQLPGVIPGLGTSLDVDTPGDPAIAQPFNPLNSTRVNIALPPQSATSLDFRRASWVGSRALELSRRNSASTAEVWSGFVEIAYGFSWITV